MKNPVKNAATAVIGDFEPERVGMIAGASPLGARIARGLQAIKKSAAIPILLFKIMSQHL